MASTSDDLFRAIADADVDRVRAILAREPGLATSRGAEVDAHGTCWMTGTPLHSAASGRHLEAARRLLEAGADPNLRQSQGFTAPHAASEHGDAALVRLLLSSGADPSATTDDGRDALAFAQGSGDDETLGLVRQATA